jgi:peptide/nickel transport system substrate-binding protein
MTRRDFAATAAGFAALGFGARAEGAGAKTLRLIASSDLRVLDPIWTTAGISRAHGYMVFDTPFALDAKFKPQPQMVGDYDIWPDQLVYSFVLRDGLKFHDGMPVGGVDCVASLRRWMARDAFGQSLATAVDKMEALGDKGFTIRLKEPFPLLLDALAKIAGPPFIMPERLAKTDPYQQITEAVGSGPYKFGKEEFQPGHIAVYVKNPDYVPRNEPPSWGVRRQGRQGRPGRVALCARRDDQGGGSRQRRSRLVGEPHTRHLADPRRQSRDHPRRARPARLDGDLALQPPPPAVRQRKNAPGGIGRCRPG